nr:phage baseplate protein [Candidatus Symbiopectobacterium sp. Dall1.0]
TATVTFTGTPLVEIPAGTLVRNRITNTLWATDTTVATNNSGIATVNVTCTTAGSQAGNSNNLSIIATPIGGITATTNVNPASLGRDEESDNAFRVRRNESVAFPGNNQIDNLYAALVNLDGVKHVRIYENPESVPDENGVDGHSLAILIDGGATEDIVATIAKRKNPGCGLNRYNTRIPNKVSIDTLTPGGNPFNATFFRPEFAPIFVLIRISSDQRFDDEAIKRALVEYSSIGFEQTTGFAKTGFRIGEDVGAGRLLTPVNYIVAGSGFVYSIGVGTSALSVGHSHVDIAFNQLGIFSVDNIEVAYV